MPRKTGYSSKSALTTLVLGDPALGTTDWSTEYDVEFTSDSRADDDNVEAKQSARASLRTPRSLKKGYVSGQDYEQLDDQYNNALSAYQDLQRQVVALKQRMASMHGNEQVLLQAVDEQQGLIEKLQQQAEAITDNVGQLLGGIERNKSLLVRMTSAQELLSPSTREQGSQEAAAQDAESMSERLTSLEAKIGDMADAVSALARAQAMIVSRPFTPGPGSARRRGDHERPSAWAARSRPPSRPEGGAEKHRGESSTRRESSNGQRRGLEKIERLPNPIHLTGRSTFWKP